MSAPSGPRIRVGRGSRHVERLLLEELEALLDGHGAELIARPATLVVPSQSLRLHLLTTLAARRPAVAGLWCRTLYGLAADLVRRAGGQLPGQLDPLDLLARRLAHDEESLARSFDHLVDGYRSVAASVSDLMDAAFDPAHAEALDEVLAQEGAEVAGPQTLARARAVVRVAAQTGAALEEEGLARRPAILQRAAEIVRGGELPDFDPAAVLVYGFADATGAATDLIEALMDRHAATLYLDRPRDPADPAAEPAGSLFGRRFRERLGTRAAAEEAGDEPAPPRLDAFRALGARAETRELARRLRALMDGGARPERIGVVARRLTPYLSALRVQCARYGVPISGLGARGPVTPAGRLATAAHDLMTQGGRAPIERWLDARRQGFGRTPDFDLRLALHSLGAGRLAEVPELPLADLLVRDKVPLPVRLGFDAVEGRGGDGDDVDGGDETGGEGDPSEDEPPRVLLIRRTVAGATLRRAAEAAAALCRRFDRWPDPAPLERHFELFRELLSDELGWPAGDPLTAEIEARLERGAHGLEGVELSLEELRLVLRELLAETGRERLGGDGGGVQVLDATEARGRTFDHLFLIGLNGELFPRTVREDPLLGDPLRRLLAREGFGVLPDLAIKRDGSEEERYLFAQLLSAAPEVTLSWQQVDDDNGARTVSPLVERLRWSESAEAVAWTAAGGDAQPPLARPVYAPGPPPGGDSTGADAVPSPLLENAVAVALAGGGRDRLTAILALGFAGLPSPRATAAARVRVLEEMDPPLTVPPRLGPYLGVVGPPLDSDDPRREDTVWVTTLERMCGCPWQTLLVRLLRLEPLPDPLETLPAIDPLLIGAIVHRAAEAIVARRLGQSGRSPAPPPGRLSLPIGWPEPEEVREILLAAAGGALRDLGIGLPGFHRVVALAAAPYLERLRQIDWPDGGRVAVLGGEVEGALELPGPLPPRRLAFRADRIDGGRRGPLYTDYKTGRRGISKAATEKYRRAALVKEIRAGLRLQVPAYARAGGGRGRYLFLHPELEGPEEAREAAVGADDRTALGAFDRAVATALDAWRAGAFPPRVVKPSEEKEPVRCRYCEVAEACVRGDSGARRRLRLWAGSPPEREDPVAAAHALWNLPLGEEGR